MEQETNDLIKSEIENNDVCLFMKGTPDAPQCGFSMATSNILKVLEVNFKGVNVLADQKLREGIKYLVTGQLFLNYMLKMSLLVDVIS